MILHIGCGEAPRHKGTLNVDIRDLPNVDIVADATKLPFEDASHDGIITRNLVEHFGRHEIAGLFKEWARVLKPGAKMSVETIDMGRLMTRWNQIPTENLLDGILGAQTYPENFHKMAFTQQILCERLEDAGFSILGVRAFIHRQIPRMEVTAQKI